MLRHPRDLYWQMMGCGTLRNLVRADPELQQAFAQSEIIDLTVASMKRWPENKELQLLCHGLLSETARSNGETAMAVAKAGALEASLEAIRRFGAESPSIIAEAGLLEYSSMENRYKLEQL